MRHLRRLIGVVALPTGDDLKKKHAVAVDVALVGDGEGCDPLRRDVASGSAKLSEDGGVLSVH